ncbi:MAG: hypothetical protein AAFY81_07405 [Pseudomonadota bacterium]
MFSSREHWQVFWFCGPLNPAALVILIAAYFVSTHQIATAVSFTVVWYVFPAALATTLLLWRWRRAPKAVNAKQISNDVVSAALAILIIYTVSAWALFLLAVEAVNTLASPKPGWAWGLGVGAAFGTLILAPVFTMIYIATAEGLALRILKRDESDADAQI